MESGAKPVIPPTDMIVTCQQKKGHVASFAIIIA
jgi:hypothetical protein